MAGLVGDGCNRSSFYLLVPISNGRELRISKELNEEAADSILASGQKVLEVIARSVRFVVHVSVSRAKVDISD